MGKWLKRIGVGIGIVLIVSVVGMVIWANDAYPATAEALDALDSSSTVSVSQDDWIVFTPIADSPTVGLIFYPGGRVDELAYAPTMHALAENGYLTIIVPMPLHLAVMAPGKAGSVIDAYPDIEHWVIAGHSLGGSMAANYLYNNSDQIDGLVLWASYPAGSNDLSSYDTTVVSLTGTIDGVATSAEIEERVDLLPADTIYLPIDGGNHAQFGYYGEQNGDNVATISLEAQQEQVIEGTLMVLERVAEK